MTSSVSRRPLSRNWTWRFFGTSPRTWYVGTGRRIRAASAQRPGDLPLLVVVDVARRPVELATVLLRPAPDRVVRLEDLGELLMRRRHLREGDLSRRQDVVAALGGHTHLDRPVVLLVDGPVVEDERCPRALDLTRQLVDRADDEALEAVDARSSRPADVGLLGHVLGADLEHALPLRSQAPAQVREDPPPATKLVRERRLERVEPRGRRMGDETANLLERHSGRPQQRDRAPLWHLVEPVVAVARPGVDARGPEEPVRVVQAQGLLRELRRGGELADRDEVLHLVAHGAACPWVRVKRPQRRPRPRAPRAAPRLQART